MKINIRLFFFLTGSALFGFIHASQEPRIHSVGGSHSFYSFTDTYKPCGHPYNETAIERPDYEPFYLYIHGTNTLYRSPGRLRYLANNKWFLDHVKVEDICVFSFGETDCRCQILKHARKQSVSVESIIDQLIQNYEKALEDFVKKFEHFKLKIVIAAVIPPLHTYHKDLPVVGTFEEHLHNVLLLNEKMRIMAERNNFYFLDLYSLYASGDGSLSFELSDKLNHLGAHATYKVWDELLRIVN